MRKFCVKQSEEWSSHVVSLVSYLFHVYPQQLDSISIRSTFQNMLIVHNRLTHQKNICWLSEPTRMRMYHFSSPLFLIELLISPCVSSILSEESALWVFVYKVVEADTRLSHHYYTPSITTKPAILRISLTTASSLSVNSHSIYKLGLFGKLESNHQALLNNVLYLY